MSAVPIIRNEGEGERLWFFGGGVHTWKATEAETGGAFLLFEDALDLGKVTPLHIHPDADETFYMLDGEIALHIDGEPRQLAAGGMAVIPRGIPHAFMVTSPEARMLCLQTPGAPHLVCLQVPRGLKPRISQAAAKRPTALGRSEAHWAQRPRMPNRRGAAATRRQHDGSRRAT